MRALDSSHKLIIFVIAIGSSLFLFQRFTTLDHEGLIERIYSHLRATNITTGIGLNDQIIEVRDGQFYYSSAESFISLNPQCCLYMVKDSQNISIPWWARISGKAVSFIKVSYRPTDKAGRPISGAEQEVRWLEVSRDGRVANRQPW